MLVGQGKKWELWSEEQWASKREQWLGEEDNVGSDIPEELQNLSL